MPFLEMAYINGLTDIKPASVYDFRLEYISTSGHKYIGTPWPTGIYLTRTGLLGSKDQGFSITVQLIRQYSFLVMLTLPSSCGHLLADIIPMISR